MNRNPLIFRAFAFALLLLLAYEGFLRLIPLAWVTGQNQSQRNVIAFERALCADPQNTPQALILGSSLSFRLSPAYFNLPAGTLPQGWDVLAAGGGSALDGLQIIRHTGRYPHLAVIETNVPMMAYNAEQVDRALGAWPALKIHALAFREAYQPTNVLPQLARVLASPNPHKWSQAAEPPTTVNPAAYQSAIAVIRDRAQRPNTRQVLDAYQQQLEGHIQDLRAHGTQVVLLSMPLDPAVDSLPRYAQLDSLSAQMATRLGLPFIDITAAALPGIQFTDGLHLDKASVLRLWPLLRQALAPHQPAPRP